MFLRRATPLNTPQTSQDAFWTEGGMIYLWAAKSDLKGNLGRFGGIHDLGRVYWVRGDTGELTSPPPPRSPLRARERKHPPGRP